MADPVSWFLIEAGWTVLAADGSEVGKVDEVTGDSNADIFDGLAISTSALGKPRYVPSEQVAEIVEGSVRLKLSPEQVEALGEYLEPATSAEIEADDKGGAAAAISGELRKLEGKTLAPTEPERPLTIWRRIRLFFRRLSG
ncbi:MAG: DUF2171 domain-containing protein [Gaiellaceae bacterium]